MAALTCGLSACSPMGTAVSTAGSYDGKAKEIVVKANMKTVQNAAEKYASDHIYLYPKAIDDEFKYYFPDGDPAAKKIGTAPTNPFTGQAEWPILGKLVEVAASRANAPDPVQMGSVEYSPIDNAKSYAIRGGDANGKAIPGDNMSNSGVLLLSRDNYSKP